MYAMFRVEPGGPLRSGSLRLLELVDRLPAQSALEEWNGEVDVWPVIGHNLIEAAGELGRAFPSQTIVWSPAVWMIV